MNNNRFILTLIIIILGLGVMYFYLQQQQQQQQAQQQPSVQLPIQMPEMSEPSESESESESQEIKTYQDALRIAKLQNKKIYLYFSASWCAWCKKFEADILSLPKVQKELDNYIFYKVDVDKEKNITSQYGVSSIPAHRIIDGNEKIIKSGRGYKGETAFVLWLKTLNQDIKNGQKRNST